MQLKTAEFGTVATSALRMAQWVTAAVVHILMKLTTAVARPIPNDVHVDIDDLKKMYNAEQKSVYTQYNLR